jgi:hypothetical protein
VERRIGGLAGSGASKGARPAGAAREQRRRGGSVGVAVAGPLPWAGPNAQCHFLI